MNEVVTLVKRDGRRIEKLQAAVTSAGIMTDNPSIPIEEGDTFERRLPSGVIELYEVIDAGFKPTFHTIPAHYQSKVRKRTTPDGARRATPPHQVIYNISGDQARININSVDASTNVKNVDMKQLFTEMRAAVQRGIAPGAECNELRERMDNLESSANTPSFAQRYAEFMQLAANHVQVLGPFFPALSQLLLNAAGG
jgi:hypothetical protein